jgi:hypothetical protein
MYLEAAMQHRERAGPPQPAGTVEHARGLKVLSFPQAHNTAMGGE